MNPGDNDDPGDDSKIIPNLIDDEFCRLWLLATYNTSPLMVKIDTPWRIDAI